MRRPHVYFEAEASKSVTQSRQQASNAQRFLREPESFLHAKSKPLTNMGPITIYIDDLLYVDLTLPKLCDIMLVIYILSGTYLIRKHVIDHAGYAAYTR